MKSGILPFLDWAIMAATSVQARANRDILIEDWSTCEAGRAMAEDRARTLKHIKIDDGCCEIYGTDKDGRRFEPKTIP